VIRVTSTALNVGTLARKSVRSVVDQTHEDWTLHFFDARSDDRTLAFALEEANDRVHVQTEEVRTGPLDKLIPLWRSFDDTDVIVWLDGDDRLATDKTLEIVASIHGQGFLCTYGTFMLTDGTVCFKGPVGPDPRNEPWRASHLKTFRAGAFKRIKDEDLRDADGRYYSLSIDRCVMLPILEMFPTQSACVSAVTYVYNFDASYEKNATPEQTAKAEACTRRIHGLPRYGREKW
jgi:glycosyltransferase involved in cell wall biosynthesis